MLEHKSKDVEPTNCRVLNFQRCPMLEHKSTDVWSVFTSIQRKMYGKMEEVKKTASFINVQGFDSVNRREHKEVYKILPIYITKVKLSN